MKNFSDFNKLQSYAYPGEEKGVTKEIVTYQIPYSELRYLPFVIFIHYLYIAD